MHIPEIVAGERQPFLLVDNRPLIILGAQWDYRQVRNRLHRDKLFEFADRLGCNTAFVPIFWDQIELEPDRYSFAVVDEILQEARKNGLKLALLWFGSNREGRCYHRLRQPYSGRDDYSTLVPQVPAYILKGMDIYRRAHLPDGTPHPWSLCPVCEPTLDRETKAFRAFLSHLAAVDAGGATIMIQINNEICTPPEIAAEQELRFLAGCCCPICLERWPLNGRRGSSDFVAAGYAAYTESLAAAGREVYPLPMYVNFVSNPRPGEDIEVFLEHAPHIFGVAPDIYPRDTDEFRQILRRYRVGRNTLFVAETSSDEHTPSEKNLLAGLGEFGIIGIDLWAIDCPYGHNAWEIDYPESASLFSPDGTPGGRAPAIIETFHLVRRVETVVAPRLGTEDLFSFIGERESSRFVFHRPEGVIEVVCEPGGHGLAVRTAPHDYTILGRRCFVLFPGSFAKAERGSWQGATWHPVELLALAAEGGVRVLHLADGDVVRVT